MDEEFKLGDKVEVVELKAPWYTKCPEFHKYLGRRGVVVEVREVSTTIRTEFGDECYVKATWRLKSLTPQVMVEYNTFPFPFNE